MLCVALPTFLSLKNNSTFIGILVDEVNEVMEIKNKQILPSPVIPGFESFNTYINGMVKHNEKLIMLLNMDKIFNTESIEGITKQIETVKELNKD